MSSIWFQGGVEKVNDIHLEHDAARYRWLRETNLVALSCIAWSSLGSTYVTGGDCDDLIDAAIVAKVK